MAITNKQLMEQILAGQKQVIDALTGNLEVMKQFEKVSEARHVAMWERLEDHSRFLENKIKGVYSINTTILKLLEAQNQPSTGLQVEENEDGTMGATTPEIPAGWEVVHPDGRLENFTIYKKTDYYLLNGVWKSCEDKDHTTGSDMIVRQAINIDISKQPKEFVAWAMDEDEEWFAYEDVPVGGVESVWGVLAGQQRGLMNSEYPTNFEGDWKDSLLVRPEALNHE